MFWEVGDGDGSQKSRSQLAGFGGRHLLSKVKLFVCLYKADHGHRLQCVFRLVVGAHEIMVSLAEVLGFQCGQLPAKVMPMARTCVSAASAAAQSRRP